VPRMIKQIFLFLSVAALWGLRNCAAAPPPLEIPHADLARTGIDQMMNGDFESAARYFRQIQKDDPESPLGYLLEADVNWWKIYLTEGNLIDPDVFEALSEATTPYDPDFRRLTDLAIQKAEAHIRARQDEALNNLYEGLAYALQARLDALRDHALATARSGKKMRNLSLTALKLDPGLTDAYFGLGVYNYFVDTLPGYVKMLRFLILLPGGNRVTGLQQIQQAMEHGQVVNAEARFHLAKNYSRTNERQFEKSLGLFRQMQQQYPHNPLWKLLVGSLEIRMGQTQAGEALYRQVVDETADPPSEIWKPLHQQAAKALALRSGK